ncbi:MAG TPA: hypothetical protein VLM85_03090 [Polyangiaceae bacterium]|nr:hypothetical protein [Polyangiaceae bacterium]
MRSSSRRSRPLRALFAAGLAALAWAPRAEAQQQAQGYALDRLYPSAPGGGWFVMDALDMHGGLGGTMELTLGYAHDPLRVASSDGSRRLAIVSDQASADFGFALTYDRWRLYLNMDAPIGSSGQSGTVDGYQFTAPTVDLTNNPDMLGDTRVGLDVRLLGKPTSLFRLGVGTQIIIPNGTFADACAHQDPRRCYVSDGTLRAMDRLLVAGDGGHFTYAGQLGVHMRPRNDAPTPEGPQGIELLFGAAAGARFALGARHALVVGPEIFGASPLRSLFGSGATSLEGLLSARLEGTGDRGAQLRVKLGAGAGLVDHLGAPEWRLVLAVEVFDRSEPGANQPPAGP